MGTSQKLENACWVCNTPFDETKPTKPFEIIEADIKVDVKIKFRALQNFK